MKGAIFVANHGLDSGEISQHGNRGIERFYLDTAPAVVLEHISPPIAEKGDRDDKQRQSCGQRDSEIPDDIGSSPAPNLIDYQKWQNERRE